MNLSLQNTDLTRLFTIKPTHPGRQKQIWAEKKLSGSPGHMRQNAYCCNLKRTLEDQMPCYCYQYRITAFVASRHISSMA